MVYIYALRDPETGSIRYIGKTKNIKMRLLTHISKAKAHHTDHHCAHWIRSLLSKGVMPELVIVNELPIGSDWKSAEADAIRSYRLAGHDLTNLTGGGDGFHDCHPDVLKRRGATRRKQLSDPEKRAEFVDRLVASRATPEVRAKTSRSLNQAWTDPVKKARMLDGMRQPDAIARRSEATRRRMHDPDIAARHAAAIKERFSKPEHRSQLEAASAKRWSDPVAREKQRAHMDELYSDPERRKAAGEASQKRWSQPDAKAKHAEKMRASWAVRRAKVAS